MRDKFAAYRPWLGAVVRIALGALWIWAAWEKLREPRTFVQAVRAYDVTPEWLSKAIGYGVPVLELALGVLLILGVAVRLAAVVSAVLFVVFIAGVVQAGARGIKLECGCFGGGGITDESTTYILDVLRDLGLLAMAVYLVLWSYTALSIEAYLGRHDYVEPPSAKRLRSDEGRRKYNALVESKRQQARERMLWMTASMGTIVAVVVLIGIGVQSNRAKISGTLSATNASVSRGVVFGKKAAATVDVYEDFQCPNCRDFEKAVGARLDADVRANKAQVRFHPIAILDSSGNHDYSTRAANAALCASDISVDAFVAYHSVLFDNQPAESASGLSDDKLQALAAKAKITGAPLSTFDSCVQNGSHKALAAALTDAASKKGINGTPTVLVNGESIGHDLAAWNKAIAAALKKGPAPNPSKTPPPTPTPTATPSPSASASPSPSKAPSRSPSPSKTKG